MINSFTIYKEYYELITLLSEKDQQELLLAIVKYMFEDIEPSLNDKQTKIFNNLKRPLDKSKNKSKNRNNSKSNSHQIRNKLKSNENQNEIKLKSNENQIRIKAETHQDVPVTVNVNVNVKDSISYCEEQFGRTLSPIEYQLIASWQEWFTDDIINLAIDKTIKNGARGLSYTEAIINSWHDKGFKTLRECELDTRPKEEKPEWFDKKFEEDKATDEEIKKLEAMLNASR